MSIHVGNRVYDIVDDTTGTVLEIKFDDFGEMGYDEILVQWDTIKKPTWCQLNTGTIKVLPELYHPKKHAHAIKAWADGKEIEFKTCSASGWYDLPDNPTWNEGTEYRIKMKAVERWHWVIQTASSYITTKKMFSEKEVANAKHINFVQKIDSSKKICYE